MAFLEEIAQMVAARGGELYGGEEVTQAQHALQCAALAEAERSVTMPEDASLYEREQVWFKLAEMVMNDLESELEKSLYQILAGVLFLAMLVLGGRQEQLRLQVNQIRRLVDVVRGDIQIELLHETEVLLELITDQRHRDVGDLDFVDSNQMQQKVERALKGRQLDSPVCGQSAGRSHSATAFGSRRS